MTKWTWMTAAALTATMSATTFAVDFAKDVQPILAKRCYECHGVEKDKGDFRMHTLAEIQKVEGLIVAGKPQESTMFQRISLPADDADIMPPKGDPLTAAEQETIKKWIAEGASFGDWKEAAAEPGKEGHGEPKVEVLPEVAAANADALKRLQEAGALAMALANNTNLLNVDFRANAAETGDAQLALLKPVSDQVAWLGLAGTKVTDTGLEQIKGLKNLRRLHLEKTAVTDAALAHLAGHAELRYLNLYNTKVTDAGLAHLKGLKNLEKLYLWQTEVTDAGAKALKEALPNLAINRGWEAPPAAVAGNMLTNGDFEKVEADGKPTGWTLGFPAEGHVQFRVIPENPKDGKASLKIVGAIPWAVASQKFPVEAGKTYNLSGFVRLNKGSAVIMFQYFTNDAFLANGSTAALTTPSAEWQQVTATAELATHPTATYISVSAVITGDSDADFDGLVLTTGAPAAAAAPAPTAEFTKFVALAAQFKADSCCDKAHKGGKVCEHPCCKEALAAGKVCEKCNKK